MTYCCRATQRSAAKYFDVMDVKKKILSKYSPGMSFWVHASPPTRRADTAV